MRIRRTHVPAQPVVRELRLRDGNVVKRTDWVSEEFDPPEAGLRVGDIKWMELDDMNGFYVIFWVYGDIDRNGEEVISDVRRDRTIHGRDL